MDYSWETILKRYQQLSDEDFSVINPDELTDEGKFAYFKARAIRSSKGYFELKKADRIKIEAKKRQSKYNVKKHIQIKKALFSSIWITIIFSFITFLAAFYIYNDMLKQHFFPDLYDYDYNGEAYKEDKYCFPGDWVEFFLKEATIQGAYKIKNLITNANGEVLKNVPHKNVDLITGGEYIYYEDKILIKNVGSFRFLLPTQNDLFGETILVSYSADFYYPELLSDKKYFVWKRKPIEGTVKVKIGTFEQLSSLNRLYHFVLWAYILIVVLIFFVAFKFRRQLSLDK